MVCIRPIFPVKCDILMCSLNCHIIILMVLTIIIVIIIILPLIILIVLTIILIILIIMIIILSETRKYWVDVQWGVVSSHRERDPL